jgi:hypothetical protein
MGGVFVREVLAAMDDQQEWMAAVLLFDEFGTAGLAPCFSIR